MVVVFVLLWLKYQVPVSFKQVVFSPIEIILPVNLNKVSIVFLSVPSLPLILVISCLGNDGLQLSVAILLVANRHPFVSDSDDCQRICGGEKGSQLVSGNSWIVKGVIFCGLSATDWKGNAFTRSEEIVFCCHGNTKKYKQPISLEKLATEYSCSLQRM